MQQWGETFRQSMIAAAIIAQIPLTAVFHAADLMCDPEEEAGPG